jgi:hypothetical protein
MKNRKNISESRLTEMFRDYYASGLKEAKTDYPYRTGRQPVNGKSFSSRRNGIINFAFATSLVIFTGICMNFYESPTPLGKAINNFYISNNLHERIPQAIERLADRLKFTEP